MGKIQKTQPVKLICGFIFKEEAYLKKAKVSLFKKFGAFDYESRILDFNYTDYYAKEFGRGLKRSFASFKRPIFPSELSKIKLITNKIEDRISYRDLRLVNIDPGYLDLAKLVLASTKDFSHRIYLDCGIYAEITLAYQGGTFRPLGWTYPDYRSAEYIDIFNQIREGYACTLRT
ncbi:MAG: DUF4416 family protein [Candidatus Omnitrophica bacterium]|nr:DUF4416 family protein [Candidatus Omnitrophota bacterium]